MLPARRRQWHPTPVLFFWKIPWMEEPGRLQSMGSLELDTTERLHFHFSLSCTREGNDNGLQCSCLENPRNGEAWWAAVYGVAQSRIRLKRLSSRCVYGEGNDNPLQCSCLENPMDGGAWQATVHGVARVEHNLATTPPPPDVFREG